MKVNKDTEKWGQVGQGMFIGQELVPIMIPKDKLNPTNALWMCINGQEIWLAKGKQLMVPQAVAEIYQNSYEKDMEAYEKMNSFTEQM